MEPIRLSPEEEKLCHDAICRMLDLYPNEIMRQVRVAVEEQARDGVEWITD